MIDFRAGEAGVVEGKINAIRFRAPRDGYTVATLELMDGRRCTIVGRMAEAVIGTEVMLEGQFVINERFGLQFMVGSVLNPIADGEIARAYLASGVIPYIGPVAASAIVDAFGSQTLPILARDPTRLLAFRGVTEKRIPKISKALADTLRHAPAIGLLDPFSVSVRVAKRASNHYGSGIIEAIRANPWRLAKDIAGVGFKTADRIALGLGFAPNDPHRAEAAIMQAVREFASEEGHITNPTKPANLPVLAAKALTSQSNEVLDTALETLIADGTLVRTTNPEGVALPRLVNAERIIAAKIRAMAAWSDERPFVVSDDDLAKIEGQLGIKFDHSQERAIRGCLESRISVITGGPGTGKTTITRAALDLWSASGLTVAAVSPTGRAAKRLSEATGYKASTIHRWLHYNPEKGFEGPDKIPDVLLVDEASMLDTPLMSTLLRYLSSFTRLLIVGDADQLPAIGPGNVLGDLLASPLTSVYRLDTIHRTESGSGIPKLAVQIRAGVREPVFDGVTTRFIPRGADASMTSEQQSHEIANWILDEVAADPDAMAGDIQVLCPMKQGPTGTEALNRELQARLNPVGKDEPYIRRGHFHLHAGDRIMQTTNDYDLDLFNGDVGYMLEVGEDGSCVVQFDGVIKKVAPRAGEGLSLAFAMTVHKAQGSEFPRVFIPMHTSSFMLLRRRLFYTAVSRAKRDVTIVGTKQAIGMAISRNERPRRTILRGLLGGLDQASLIDPALLAGADDDDF